MNRALGSAWKLGGLSLAQLGKRVWVAIGRDEILDRSAALSYYLIFALLPTLLFLTALPALLPIKLASPGSTVDLDRLLDDAQDGPPRPAVARAAKTPCPLWQHP